MTSINGKRRRIGDDVVYFFHISVCGIIGSAACGNHHICICQGNRPGKLAVSDQRDIRLKRHCRNSGKPAQYTLHHNYHHAHSNSCRSGSSRVLE